MRFTPPARVGEAAPDTDLAARGAGGAHAKQGLQIALRRRRAVVCVQRGWRWSLLKRRLELLSGAAAYLRTVRGSCLYMEERLFMSLNLIASVDRYAPLLAEGVLSFGHATHGEAGNGGVVLVREDIVGAAHRRKLSGKEVQAAFSARATMKEPLLWQMSPASRSRVERRVGGLPKWLVSQLGEFREVGPYDPSLQAVAGLQGLLLHGALDRADAETAMVVEVASFHHVARQLAGGDKDAGGLPPAALVASGGAFRFVELRFPSPAQAKLHALAVYFCTYSARLHLAVPLMTKATLHQLEGCRQILELWDLYGLTWPDGDRVAPQRARLWDTHHVQFVPCCGRLEMRNLERPDKWAESLAQEKEDGAVQTSKAWLESRQRALQEATIRKYDSLIGSFAQRKRVEHRRLEDMVRDLDMEQLRERLERPPLPPGNGTDVCVSGALPPTAAVRVETARVVEVARADKAAALALGAAAREAEEEEKARIHDSVIASRGHAREGLEFEDRLMAFYEHCDEERRAKKIAESQAKCDAAQTRQLQKVRERQAKASSVPPPKRSGAETLGHGTLREYEEELARERLVAARAAEEARAHEEARARVQRQKAKRAASRDTAEALRAFAGRRTTMERLVRSEDHARAREARLEEKTARVAAKCLEWEQHARALEERNEAFQWQRLREVDALRAQLSQLMEAKRQQEESAREEVRQRATDKKSLDRLLRAARQQLAVCEQIALPLEEAGGRKGPGGGSGNGTPEIPEDRAGEYEAAVASVVDIAGRVALALQGAGGATPRRPGAAPGAQEALPPVQAPSLNKPPQPPAFGPSTPRLPQVSQPSPRQAIGGGGALATTPRVPLAGRGRLPDAADPWLRKLGAAHLAMR